MGFSLEMNWVLKLTPEQGLDERRLQKDAECDFSKPGSRVYPIGIPIDLVNSSWDALAKVIVQESTVKGNTTSGRFKIVRLYQGAEKEILSNNWRENSKIMG